MIFQLLTFLAFGLLSFSILSVWVRRDPKIWGSLLLLSIGAAFINGHLSWVSVLIFVTWAALWMLFIRYAKNRVLHLALFLSFVVFSFVFKFSSFFPPLFFTEKFKIGFATSILGIFPLALVVPLARSKGEWKKVGIGFLWGVLGIIVIAVLAVLSKAVTWQAHMPSYAGVRFWNNLVLVATPEEAFYRGFVQRELCKFLPNTKGGKGIALLLSSCIFTLAHIFWSPSLDILAFVFVAGLLYGGVYLLSGKIESAILTHFLLNFIHMTFFSYHAM